MSPIHAAVLVLGSLLATAPAPTRAQAAEAAGASGCTATLSGAVTARFACTVTTHIEGKLATVTITADAPVTGVRAIQPAIVKVAMPVATGTFSGAALSSSASSLETSSGAAYAAGGGKGEVTLVVDQAEPYRQLPNHLVLSGSLKARLVPAKPAKGGEVILEVRF